jgi:hypothetical protein
VPEGLILRWLTERVGPLTWHEVQRAEGIPHTGRSQTSPAPIPNAAAIAVMSDANKLALRARLQAGHVPHPDGAAVEVAGGYGDGLDPGVVGPLVGEPSLWGIWSVRGRLLTETGL